MMESIAGAQEGFDRICAPVGSSRATDRPRPWSERGPCGVPEMFSNLQLTGALPATSGVNSNHASSRKTVSLQ